MNEKLVFVKYTKCFKMSRCINVEFSKAEKSSKEWFLLGGAISGLLAGIISVLIFFKQEYWAFKGLIIEFFLFSCMWLSLYVFDVKKAVKLYNNKEINNFHGVILGDWKTLEMREKEQMNFKLNLIDAGILTRDNDAKNLDIINNDIQYLLTLVERKKTKFKELIKIYSGIYLFFFSAIWAGYIKNITNSDVLFQIFIISVLVASMVCVIRWIVYKFVLEETDFCMIICDELTEIKNDIIRREEGNEIKAS